MNNMETIYKKCIYCDEMTSDPHFVSGCCGRGMCENCFDRGQGTEEQIQIVNMEDEDYEKYIAGTRAEKECWDYVCFNCLKTKI